MSEDRGALRSERIYRWLLRLYPESFRDRFGEDATELFTDHLAEARGAGRVSVVMFWVRTVANVFVHGALERLSDLRTRGVSDAFSTFRHALRQCRRAPVLSGAVVLTLALGIGANVALFGLIRGVLLRPLPYPDADELVQLWETGPDTDAERLGPSPLNFIDWASEAESFESMTAWYLTSGTYRTEEWVEEIRSAQVTADFFRTLGVEPLIGRGFRTDEVTEYGPVVLSYGMWRRLFGGDPTVVGQSIISSGRSYQIVGVMPAGFNFPDPSVETWIAWSLPAVYSDRPETRTWRFLNGTARLRGDRTLQSTRDELDAIAASLEDRYPESNRGWGAEATSLHEDTVGEVRATLWIAFVAVALVLLVACTNVANLLLARVPRRMAEVSLRQAIGASRGRIAGELLVENLVLGVVAAGVGLGVGAFLLEGLVALDAGGIPRLSEVRIDGAVFAFAALA
ncbi:MAG: FtsX-like permease family protein, partial [Gemmatimonadetes bacterium]|nr:FtsX-like permease family protein [Gemmatimonadota bacterium]